MMALAPCCGGCKPGCMDIVPEFMEQIPPDPFTGRNLVYRREGDGFVLYSLGENLTDHGGAPKTLENKGNEGYDIVWRAVGHSR